ncbi:glycosyltransferase, group 1 family protein [Alloprevotella sp. oral taxon 473 str. F0040]|nr:glycosyltransferase, group 1 family protein [Alloprevotella sp. oral taxon 473 str. F0040]
MPSQPKTLHVITSLRTGGAERLMVDLLPRLQERGLQVELAVLDGTATDFYSALEAQGIPIHALGMGVRAMHSPCCIPALRRLMRQFDIVHTHNTPSQYFVAIASMGMKLAPKLVTTEHNTTNTRRNIPWLRCVDSWMYSRYAEIIGVSQSTTQALLDYLPQLPHCLTINNGIVVTKFQEAFPANDIIEQYSQYKRLVVAAAFRAQKDHETIIRALHLLPDDYHLLLAGDGNRRKIVEEFGAQEQLSQRVHFLGNRNDVANVLKAADVIVMSSRYEGLSLSSLEGLASGRPVVASDVPGLREIVGNAGILFPQGDAQALAKTILALEEHPKLRQQTIEKGLQRAHQYDISTMIEAYWQVYQSL